MKTTPHLIQRGKISDRDWKNGIDSIINFDYMGSSEFEWGALPESLGRIRKEISEYTYLDIPFKDSVITVFCNSAIKTEMKDFLKKLDSREYRLKEFSGFPEVFRKEEFYLTESICVDCLLERVNFWWDIDNDFMFWIKNSLFELKFKEKIEPKQ